MNCNNLFADGKQSEQEISETWEDVAEHQEGSQEKEENEIRRKFQFLGSSFDSRSTEFRWKTLQEIGPAQREVWSQTDVFRPGKTYVF